MTKQELIDKINSKPKKSQVLIQWNHGGNVGNPQNMIYSGHDDGQMFGFRPNGGGAVNTNWDQAAHVYNVHYFKPDVITKSLIVGQPKFPSSDDRYVGIEMEIISKMDFQVLSEAIALAGLENFVNVATDGSINRSTAYPHAHELRILSKEREMPRIIKQVCKILHGKTSVNKSCGLHVHLDMRKRNPDMAYANLFSSQALLYAMCPKTRLTNNFCKPANSYYKMTTMGGGDDRYRGINPTAFQRHKTIEVRIHSGTVNAFKIINWVKLLVQIADKPTENVDNVSVWKNYKEAKRLVGLRGMLEKYVSSRIEEFAEDHEETTGTMRMTA
jgi:Putative amidoligase enzyme